MTSNVGDIRGGMIVFGLDGQELGTVEDVRLGRLDPDTPNVAEAVDVTATAGPMNRNGDKAGEVFERQGHRAAGSEEGEARPTISPMPGSSSYFSMRRDGETYRIPFDAVASVFPGQNVTLDCTREECVRRYPLDRASE